MSTFSAKIILSVIFPAIMLFTGCCAAENLSSSDRIVSDVNYANSEKADPRQKLDLRIPPQADNAPVLVMIHGGAWCIGNRDNGNNGADSDKARFFTAHGIIYVTISYRLSPAVQHPEHVRDIAAALKYIHDHIAEYGGDPERIYVMGHSAGAHLAALVAIDQRYIDAVKLPPQSLKGVILLDGAGYDLPRHIAELPRFGMLRGCFIKAFTEDSEKQKDASPALQVKADMHIPPFLMFYVSRRDDAKEQNTLLSNVLKRNGYLARTVPVDSKTHASINREIGEPSDLVTKKILDFICPGGK